MLFHFLFYGLTAVAAGCSDGGGNCLSVVSDVETGFSRTRRDTDVDTDHKGLLIATKDLTNSFADLKMDSFIQDYLKVAPIALINALKGFSILASILAAFIPQPDSTKEILDKMDEGFNKIIYQIDRQTEELKSYIDDGYFMQNVKVPLSTLTFRMAECIKVPSPDNNMVFMHDYHNIVVDNVIGHISSVAPKMLMNAIESSKYDWNTFNNLCVLITREFHVAFTVQIFAIGLQFKHGGEAYNRQMQITAKRHEEANKQLSEILNKATEKFDGTFFPGFIKEEIVQPAIDRGGSNCELSEKIVQQLTKKYPKHQYVAVVSESRSKFKTMYDIHGYQNRSLVVHDYHRRSVFMFMASPDVAKHKSKYGAKDIRQDWIDFNNAAVKPLHILTRYAKRTTNEIQMMALPFSYYSCRRPLGVDFVDVAEPMFKIEVPGDHPYIEDTPFFIMVIF